jgi:hypothetical protein
MPREIVHWTVLSKATTLLKERKRAPNVVRCLEEVREAAFLGALAHDAPYYFKFGGDPFEAAAEYLHGEGSKDTLLPIRIAAEAVSTDVAISEQAQHWAFLLGMTSHAVTDWVFHPMVFFYTGNYNDPNSQKRTEARLRHRLFETYLDSWFRIENKFWNNYHLFASLRALGKRMNGIYKVLDEVMVPETFDYHRAGSAGTSEVISKLRVKSVNGRWKGSINYLVALQTAFLSPLCGNLALLLSKAFESRLAQYEVLFSRGRLIPFDRFNMPLQFKNPVSGDSITASVSELCEEAVTQCVEIFECFDALVAGSADASSLKTMKGKSLNFGICGASVDQAIHFSKNGIELPGLEIDDIRE